MSWLQFLLWITAIYTAYYLGMIFFDSLQAGRVPVDKNLLPELVFEESVEPVGPESFVAAEAAENDSGAGSTVAVQRMREPAMISSGGVSLKDLFELARTEAIIYTRAVSH